MKVEYSEVEEIITNGTLERIICSHFGKGHNEELITCVRIINNIPTLTFKVMHNKENIFETRILKDALDKYNSLQ